MFKKCIAPNCNTIAWFSESGICKKCDKEAREVIDRIAQSRNSGNRPSRIDNKTDYENLHNLQAFNLLVNETPVQSNETKDCSTTTYINTPSYSSNESNSNCSSGSSDY